MMFYDLLPWVTMLLGSFFVITGVIGIIKFEGILLKLHPAGIIDATGIPLMIISFMFCSGWSLYTLKLLFIILLLWITSTTSCHALAKTYKTMHM